MIIACLRDSIIERSPRVHASIYDPNLSCVSRVYLEVIRENRTKNNNRINEKKKIEENELKKKKITKNKNKIRKSARSKSIV